MREINIHEAKTHLSRLVEGAARGEPFVTAKAGKPMVKAERPPAAVYGRLADAGNTPAFSVVSLWEVVLKAGRLKQELGIEPHLFRQAWLDAGYRAIAVTGDRVVAVARLPSVHKDLFDRLLIAQTAVEGAALLTADADMARYGRPVQFVG